MQVTKYGRIKAKKLDCTGCGASLAYAPKDLKYKKLPGGAYVYVTCPVCGRHNEAETWRAEK